MNKKIKGKSTAKKAEAIDLFAHYVSLGHIRTLQQVADKFGCSFACIAKISAEQQWSPKIKAIEEEAQKKIMHEAASKMVLDVKFLTTMRRNSLVAMAKKIANVDKNGKTKATTRDLKTAYEMSRTEQGLPITYSKEIENDIRSGKSPIPIDEAKNIEAAAQANGQTEFKKSLEKDEL